MAHKRIDEPTGTATVGHEWDGIEELDTPLPRWWLITFFLCIVFAIGYVIFYPAIPLANSATPGTLGWSARGDLAREMSADASRRAPIYKAIASTPVEQLPANPALLAQAVEGGRAAFKVHCVQCHGAGAAGGAGYPNLNDDDWLWGGDLKSIETTLIHGIRNPEHDETRFSQMPAFGEILSDRQVRQVIAHVRSLSGLEKPNSAGAVVFAENCAACHGENGKGNREVGAPNLTDGIWLYGSDRKALRHTISYARNGVMPRWNERLSPVTIRMLAAYVHSLGGGEATPAPAAPEIAGEPQAADKVPMSALDLFSPDSQFYQKRKGVYPKAVTGFYRRLKWLIMAVTLTIYYVTPWLRWDRGAYAPDQAVLIDLANRRFYMFSIEIWPQEFYYVAGLLIMAGIGLFLVTSAVGRAWCGYACPQTVWTDLFVHVERFIDGDRNAQIKLANAPLSAAKLTRRATKYAIWLLIAVATGGAWIFYFADAPTLLGNFVSGDAAFVAYATVGVLTATTFIFGGFMREQVCIYMCPWPRIQTAMLDEKSLIVTYKDWRGEPRTQGLKKAVALEADFPVESIAGQMAAKSPPRTGDCISCNQCVAVCPTGIDIREGPQLGCITCALCIDACDKVMAQIGRPRGLIDYATLDDAVVEKAGGTAKPILKTLLRPRTLAYFMLWAGIGLAMLFSLGQRTRLDISSEPDRNPRFVQLSDGSIRNAYTVKLRNMETRPRSVDLMIEGLPDAVLWTDVGSREAAGNSLRVAMAPDAATQLRVFVAAPAPGEEHTPFRIVARPTDGAPGSREARPAQDEVSFERPEREADGPGDGE